MKTTNQVCLILILLTGWLGISQERAIADTVLEVRTGTASIENSALRRLRTASPGMSIQVGDLIRPFFDAVVVIRCDSGSVRRVRSLVGLGDVCPDSVGRRFTNTGRGEDDFLLFLNHLFTYATQVIDAQPVLRWNPVEGVSTYAVQVLQDESVLWEDTVEGTTVVYGGEALEAGGSYTLIVTALDGVDGGDRGDEGDGEGVVRRSRLLIRRIRDVEAAAVQDAVAQLEAQDLSEEGRAIALVQIYRGVAQPNTSPPEGTGLILELIPHVESVVEAGSENPYIYRLLGDVYLQVGLIHSAQSQYEEVIRLTATGQDLPSRAAAWVGLANIAAIVGDEAMAEQHLQFAQIHYGAIADDSRVERIDEWLSRLNRE